MRLSHSRKYIKVMSEFSKSLKLTRHEWGDNSNTVVMLIVQDDDINFDMDISTLTEFDPILSLTFYGAKINS